MEHDSKSQSRSEQAFEELVSRLIIVGWVSLFLSAVLLAVSILVVGNETGTEFQQAVWLTLARSVGIVAFVIGLVGIFNRRWTAGTLLIGGSVFLPGLSFLFHGSI